MGDTKVASASSKCGGRTRHRAPGRDALVSDALGATFDRVGGKIVEQIEHARRNTVGRLQHLPESSGRDLAGRPKRQVAQDGNNEFLKLFVTLPSR
jgi:hypothetical protein